MPARYKNVATPKQREIRARLRPVDRWVSPLGRPSTTVGGQARCCIRDRRRNEISRWQLVGPRSRRVAIRLQVPPRLAGNRSRTGCSGGTRTSSHCKRPIRNRYAAIVKGSDSSERRDRVWHGPPRSSPGISSRRPAPTDAPWCSWDAYGC